jgi:hypothetical protein
MSLSLLLPAGLFALFALALPLLLHLQRRRQTPAPRLFAALAYIDPQALPRKRLRIQDWPLLILRLLLLAAIALLLAQPLLQGRAGPHWVLLWPGLDPAQAGVVPEGAELRWLLPGFPEVDARATPPSVERPEPLSLLRQLAFERPLEQKLSLRLPSRIEGLDGALPALGRAIDWQIVQTGIEASESLPAPPLQVAVLGEPPQVFVALQNFLASEDAPRLSLIEAGAAPTSSADAADAEVVLQFGAAALPEAWQTWLETGGRVLRIASAAPAESAAGAAGDTGAEGHETDAGASEGADTPGIAARASDAAAVLFWQGEHAQVSRERVGMGELRTLDCPLVPACLPELYEGNFPALFASWLAPPPSPPDAGLAQALAPIEGGPAPQPVGEPLRAPLLALILLLLALERWLAAARPRP